MTMVLILRNVVVFYEILGYNQKQTTIM